MIRSLFPLVQFQNNLFSNVATNFQRDSKIYLYSPTRMPANTSRLERILA